MIKIKHTFIAYLLINLLSACGGGSGNSGSGGGSNTGGEGGGSNGQYDLTEYLFDKSLNVTSATKSYPVAIYAKSTGDLSIRYTDKFEKTFDDTIYWTTDDVPSSTFVVTATTIEETVHSAEDSLRTLKRFADVGTKYMDANADSGFFGIQNARCTVIKHHDSIDLGTLTGTFTLVSGVYSDVLEINCVTGFVINNEVAEHTNLTHYFVRDIGLVFSEGTLILFDEVYMVSEI